LSLLFLMMRRLFQLSGVLIGISVVTFLLLHLAPGDPARLLAGARATPETIAAIRSEYGLDQPLWRQSRPTS
jgi:peptide/nickel transport system permease protein